MKTLIIRTDIDEINEHGRLMTGVDSAITMELYIKYRCSATNCHLHISANHVWSKYTYIDEKWEYIGTFDTMQELYEAQTRRFIHSEPEIGEVLIQTHEQWLNKANPNWKKEKRYQTW